MAQPTTPIQPATQPGSPPVASSRRPFLVEHGWDTCTARELAANASLVNQLPFDGVSVRAEAEPLSRRRVSADLAIRDLSAMPVMPNVSHNFLVLRMVDNARAGGPQAYDFYDDALWSTISQNVADYAAAARTAPGFDGIMIDTEYYGTGPNPWDYGTSTIPWTASATAGAVPGRSQAEAIAIVQSRGRQVMDAIRSTWPAAKVMHFRGPWLSESATYTPTRFNGNNVAWANELNGPFVLGFVSSAIGSQAQVIDGTELSTQRSLLDFQNVYRWAKTGFADFGGRLLPSGDVTAQAYKAHISVAQEVFDRDALHGYATLPPEQLRDLITWAMQTSDSYAWLYTEAYDWRSTGWPTTRVTAPYVQAVAAARAAWVRP